MVTPIWLKDIVAFVLFEVRTCLLSIHFLQVGLTVQLARPRVQEAIFLFLSELHLLRESPDKGKGTKASSAFLMATATSSSDVNSLPCP